MGSQMTQKLYGTGTVGDTLLRFSRPPMTLSVAASKSTMLTSSLPPRAAMRAASLHTLAMSAPAHMLSTYQLSGQGQTCAIGNHSCQVQDTSNAMHEEMSHVILAPELIDRSPIMAASVCVEQ